MNEMPDPKKYKGFSRLVLQYCEKFKQIIDKQKQGTLSEIDWASMEDLVDIANFQRVGMFLTDKVEVSTWQQYKEITKQFVAMADWEGTLRRITEVPGLVFLELEERITTGNILNIYNTVTVYKFNKAKKLVHLDVYVAHLETKTK